MEVLPADVPRQQKAHLTNWADALETLLPKAIEEIDRREQTTAPRNAPQALQPLGEQDRPSSGRPAPTGPDSPDAGTTEASSHTTVAAVHGRLDGTAKLGDATVLPGRVIPGDEGGGLVQPEQPGSIGMARRGESAVVRHSAELESFLQSCGLNPRNIHPGELLDIDAKKSPYWEYLNKIQEALREEFSHYTEEESYFLTGWVQLMFEVDRRGRVRKSHIWVRRNPGPDKQVLVDIARGTVLEAELPKIPEDYRKARFFLMARFYFGVWPDSGDGVFRRGK